MYAEQNKLEAENACANIYNRYAESTNRGLPTSHQRKWLERCSWNWLKTNIEHKATKRKDRVTQQKLNLIKGYINGEVIYINIFCIFNKLSINFYFLEST